MNGGCDAKTHETLFSIRIDCITKTVNFDIYVGYFVFTVPQISLAKISRLILNTAHYSIQKDEM